LIEKSLVSVPKIFAYMATVPNYALPYAMKSFTGYEAISLCFLSNAERQELPNTYLSWCAIYQVGEISLFLHTAILRILSLRKQ
jgi:hypothetical protein